MNVNKAGIFVCMYGKHVPHVYTDNELSKFLTGKGDRKMAWVEKGRNIFVKLLTNKPEQAKGSCEYTLYWTIGSILKGDCMEDSWDGIVLKGDYSE